MKIEIKIEGMMCNHCSGRVKAALETIQNAKNVDVSHKKGLAVIKTDTPIPETQIKDLIENEGYKVVSVSVK